MSNQDGNAPSDAKRALVELMLRQAGIPAKKKAVPAPAARTASDRPFPLTDMQQSYWVGQSDFFELGRVSPSGYIEFEAIELDVARFERAWQLLIDRHSMLRAIVLPSGEQQVLQQVPRFQIPSEDLRGLPATEVERRLADARRRLERGPNTERWPLFALELYRLDDRTLFFFNLSPLIADALSVHLLLEEWSTLYRDPKVQLPAIDYSFQEYVQGIEALTKSPAYERAQAYWSERLATLPPPPELPARRVSDATAAQGMYRLSGHLSAERWMQVKRRAARSGLTLNVVLCTAFSDVLAAWSRSPNFTLNVVAMNRPPLHPHVGRIVGNFSSPLLLQVDASQPSQFVQRARRLQDQLMRDLEHGAFNGIRVMRELNRMHRRAAAATIPVVFASVLGGLNPQSGSSAVGTILRPLYGSIRTPQVWIDHQVHETDDSLHYGWDILGDIFPAGVPEAIFDAWERLLAQLADDDGTWTGELLELTPPEQLALRARTNATQVPVAPLLLHELFEQRAAKEPAALAVCDGVRELRYGELAHMASRLAARLRAMGARPNRLIAVAMDKGWEQVVSTLAILKAGAAYVPLDPTLPQERMRHLIDVTEAAVVLTQSRWLTTLSWLTDVVLLAVDQFGEEDGPAADSQTQTSATAADLAYVIFTSGSTGVPKGVMIDHRGAVNTCLDLNRRFDIKPNDRVLALSSLSFDLSVYDLFGLLAAGGTVVFPAAESSRDPAHWLACMERHQVTLWNSVPALLELLLTHLAVEKQLLPASLQTVMLSGDWIPVSLPDRLRALSAGVKVISLGGATEASIWSVFYPIEQIDPSWPSIPYGRPLDNQTLHILSDALSPRPDWVPGNLYIGGIGLAQGYWRDAEKSRSAFIVHPRTGERLYRTGDMGRYLPDGDIEFLGRQDFQVKVNGYRIELGEIETVLGQHPSVRATVVIADGERGQKRLVAYVVLHAGAAAPTAELRDFLLDRLPDYMVPTRYFVVPELKRTANGKIDRSAMAMDQQEAEGAQPGAQNAAMERGPRTVRREPQSELERTLLALWESLLDVRPIDTTDNFFDIGGNSLTAVRLLGRIDQQLGRRIRAATLLRHGTIQQLAQLLGTAASQPQRSPLVPIKPGQGRSQLFLMHPIGGGVMCYSGLARQLAADQPMFGLQAPGYDDDETPLTSIEELAERYASAIQQQQPHGPYLLGGWSFGGAVAFATAQRLLARGERIGLVALLDVYPLGDPDGFAPLSDLQLLQLFLDDLAAQSGKRPGELLPDGLPADGAFERLTAEARRSGILPRELTAEQLQRLLAVFRANRTAARAYAAAPLAAPLLLLRAEGSAYARPGLPDGGWHAVARGGWSMQTLPGDHYSMLLPPNLGQLAAILQRALDAAEECAARPDVGTRSPR